uniref:Uncharacterized protein n=1 Tax=Oryza punctata TaxID=4537 RepID=A0A0E0KD35_ORYPU
MNGGSPVMTERERRAYRYGQASSPTARAVGQLGCIRKSWSNDSLSSYGGGGRAGGGAQACVCAPTTHPGSFRCKHHRHNASNLGAAATPVQVVDVDADAKHQEAQEQEVSSTEQEEKAT